MTTLRINRILFGTDNNIERITDIPLISIVSVMPICYDNVANPCAGIVVHYTNGTNDVFYDNKQGVLSLKYI